MIFVKTVISMHSYSMNFNQILKFAELYSEAVKSSTGNEHDEILSLGAHPRADYQREYMRNRYHSTRERIIKELGSKCAKCGKKSGPFHFDHIDKKKKRIRGSDVHSVNDKDLEKEIKNLQLLCVDCHKQKTHDAWDYGAPKPKHGTYWQYRKHGCRCNKCTKAYKETMKAWREKAKAK
jgi:hypothetical protein